MQRVLQRSCRVRSVDSVTSETCMRRCLGVFDLVVIGVGSMVGSGIYIMAGIAAKNQAGPAIVLSFVIAALVVLLVAACFTELASRLHKTGSTYLYIYLTIGELPAFLCGFGILLLSLFGSAINARALTYYADSMFDGAIARYVELHLASWTVGAPIARYPDFLAVVVVVIITMVVAFGVQCSAKLSAVFVVINISILAFVITCGFIFGDIRNWSEAVDLSILNSTSNFTDLYSNSSFHFAWETFAPFGWIGITQAASMCFWAFSGFEMITCAVEESVNPRRNIPLAMGIALALVTILYVGTASALTLMVFWPSIDANAPLSAALPHVGLNWGRYVVSCGTLCGFATALLNNIYGFARMALAMAEDGLLPACFARIPQGTGVPTLSVVTCGIMASAVALCLDLSNLVEFSVNLILLSYTTVSIAIIVLRYKPSESNHLEDTRLSGQSGLLMKVNSNIGISLNDSLLGNGELFSDDDGVSNICNYAIIDNHEDISKNYDKGTLVNKSKMVNNDIEPVEINSSSHYLREPFKCLEPLSNGGCVKIALALMILFIIGLALSVVYASVELEHKVWWSIFIIVVLSLTILVFITVIAMHRQTVVSGSELRVPCIPLIPSAAILFSLTLLVANSTKSSWIGTAIVFGLAMVIYFLYSVHRSKLNDDPRQLIIVNRDSSCELTAHLLESESENEEEFI